MFTISKQFHFSASHQLSGLPLGHPCGRLHGHNYRVELVLCAPIPDSRGFIVDYGDFAPFEYYIKEELDHRHLNDMLDFSPTAEHLAEHLFRIAEQEWQSLVHCVRVSETEKTWAEYTK